MHSRELYVLSFAMKIRTVTRNSSTNGMVQACDMRYRSSSRALSIGVSLHLVSSRVNPSVWLV